MDGALFDHNRVDLSDGFSVSIYGGDASDQTRSDLARGARHLHRDTLPSAPNVEKDLRDYRLRSFVFQRVRSGGAVV